MIGDGIGVNGVGFNVKRGWGYLEKVQREYKILLGFGRKVEICGEREEKVGIL